MDLNEKLAQRRHEREQEVEAAQAQLSAVEAAKKEFIKAEAKKRLAEEGYPILAEDSMSQAETEKRIEAEKEALIQKMVSAKWTKVDNRVLAVLVIAMIAFWFIWWPMSIGLMVWSLFYVKGKNEKYRQLLKDEADLNEQKQVTN